MSNETMTVWGFWITVAGTALSLIGLSITILISVNTSKIRINLMKKHLEQNYRKTKKSIILQLVTSYSLLKDDNILDEANIDESIIALKIYEEILSRITKRKLKSLQKKVDNTILNKTIKGKKEIRKLMFEIIQRLENELDEHTEFLKEITK